MMYSSIKGIHASFVKFCLNSRVPLNLIHWHLFKHWPSCVPYNGGTLTAPLTLPVRH